ncbi:hypothetical protein CVT24_010156 [Panaeolus cyanescens]|uniref:G domain-containing protein n=1 Tax=Panaeolus cyanescens TaxID=181874 RepID=A0A409W9B7_9AGAR|nr:hypothetical protein CVT24_010156 [Panaeolus cyanescens]
MDAEYDFLEVTGPISVQRMEGDYTLSSWNDEVIMSTSRLLGLTGTGKSNFIECLHGGTAQDSPRISGDSLESVTQDVVCYKLVNVASKYLHDTIFIVDCPGFSDTNLSEVAVILKLQNWIATYRAKGGIKSVLYFHRINDTRLAGSQRKTIELVKGLIGRSGGLTTLGVVTTMWDTLWRPDQLEGAESRYQQLQSEYFMAKSSLDAEYVFRFDNTQQSALRAIDEVIFPPPLLGNRSPPLLKDMTGSSDALRKARYGALLYDLLVQRVTEVQQQIQNIDADIKHEMMLEQSNEELLQLLAGNRAAAEGFLAELMSEEEDFGGPPEIPAPRLGLRHRLTSYFKRKLHHNG